MFNVMFYMPNVFCSLSSIRASFLYCCYIFSAVVPRTAILFRFDVGPQTPHSPSLQASGLQYTHQSAGLVCRLRVCNIPTSLQV